ncbi:ATP-dependent DNA helicase RecG [Myroides odoratimimus]|uniref:ATP-dependent DNA helicase RecG n=1 Tax=Myroides odoratimimus CCUG 10230 TaxID=883150 RepID=A0ABP2N9X6_9FLAO|nr:MULTISPECIES: ATP-dependent DNA helicase RecG [Myroides]AJA69835.1 ATP-dependent DNA helicase RecG [Myroides sp. A21]EHO08570.1 ATP-dependent DNA helicase RecG [Myroides odoratimimus CCUG 10230]EPH12438.1 ATP-dependent DNA helicase RecG [Myroides odoratimimus CCUG 12700]STZ48342.1 ATP-dependent DNA helicase recG [Myroides odoratimimus]GAQ13093.1 ATP-dependent DNA helicase RecG [Myroides odoratimimus]
MSKNLLDTPIEYLKGVGPQRADLFKRELGIFTYRDLLHLYPNRYIDRTQYYKINELYNNNSEVQIVGKIIHIKTVEQKRGKRLVATFTDGTGQIELVWFQGYKWIQENLKLNTPYVAFGKLNSFNNTFSMPHPELDLLEEHQKNIANAMQAVYPSTEKFGARISNKSIIKMMMQLVKETHPLFIDTLSDEFKRKLNLISMQEALINIHFPKNMDMLNKAQFRLKFEELFYVQLQLLIKNIARKDKIKGYPFEKVGDYFNTFYSEHLPFPLTGAQKRVLKEIRNDVGAPAQMNRLLQGDVGSGKTIVAFMSCLLALDNGFQACIVAPTEILATQHYVGIKELGEPLGLKIKLLTGSTKTAERRVLHEELASGELHILIGTHALFEDKVIFKNLGLAIIDEQHRFGVEQRSKLWHKNELPPHVLVMTATPIPRTLAMSLYGDLDISVIDELPPGRKPIQTNHYFEGKRLAVWHFLKTEIAKGRQVYIVYPLIDESETLDYKNLMEGYEAISRDFPLPEYSVSIVHGQMTPAEKDREMDRFIKGETNIMVATTVIEVGVNVPNASVMIIESAERFGLSQLHQLRGRVGRGAEQSYCILMTGDKLSNDSKIRMETMCRTNDGFEISEVDLKLRGPGDIMGTQQSGTLPLKIADIVKDQEIMLYARHHAVQLLKEDPTLEEPENQRIKNKLNILNSKTTIWNYIS